MGRKAKQKQPENPFLKQLGEALKHFDEPRWLGEQSPLAKPYFLGQALLAADKDGAASALVRGKILQGILRQAAEHLTSQTEDGVEDREILDLRYFKRTLTESQIHEKLVLSKSSFHRRRNRAIQNLSEALIRYLNPAQRLESPIVPGALLGRTSLIRDCLKSLKRGETVVLSGPSGIGKTTVGAKIVDELKRPTFFFTFRAGLNDQLHSLLFALGYFLHGQGAPDLWLHLSTTTETTVNWEVAISMVRYALESQKPAPLLCFDEVDLLQAVEVEAHGQIVNFLDSLRGVTPLLFIGQRVLLGSDQHRALDGLVRTDIDKLLTHAQIQLTGSQLIQLHEFTQGNPRLIELFIALHDSGERIDQLFAQMPETPSVEFFLNRILQRLTEIERWILLSLSAYRRPAPIDFWRVDEQWTKEEVQFALTTLQERHLLQSDGVAAVTLLPIYRSALYRQLNADQREKLHEQAAAVREDAQEYTAAAYHYVQMGAPKAAIWLWRIHMQQEINQGQGAAASLLFHDIASRDLEPESREALTLIRSKLAFLAADYQQVRRNLESLRWQTPVLQVEAYELEGNIATQESRFDRAEQIYRQGVEAAQSVVETRLPYFYKNLSWLYVRQSRYDQAWQEALRGRYETENIQGRIQHNQGNLVEAESHYREAMKIANQLAYTEGEAKTWLNLGHIGMQQGEFKSAIDALQKANGYYEQIGDLVNQAGCQATLGSTYNMIERYEQSILHAEKALALFVRVDNPWGKAISHQSLAESHTILGDFEKAEQHILASIYLEEQNVLSDSFRTLGEIKLAQGEVEEAVMHVQRSIDFAQENADLFLEGYAWRVMGQIYLVQSRLDDAKAAKAKAIECFEEIGAQHEVEKTEAMK